MTNVSKHQLPKKIQHQLYSQFTSLFVSADQTKISAVFDSVFSEVEKIMFIKRVAIVLMLDRGLSAYAIAKSLKVTEVTVRVHRDKYLAGEYAAIVSMVKKKSFNVSKFLDGLDELLRLGMPSYGKDRWKALRGL